MYLYSFTVDDLLARYGCKTDIELADMLGFDKSTVSVWRTNGLPSGYQKFLNVEVNTPNSRKKINPNQQATT